MQFFKFSYLFVFLLVCMSLISCTPKNTKSASAAETTPSKETESSTISSSQENKEEEKQYTFTYKMGSEPKLEQKGKTVSVLLSKKELEDENGKKYYHTALQFQVYYENKIGFKFVVTDKEVIKSINGQYPFTKTINFEAGKAVSHMTIMIVDTEGKNQPFSVDKTSMGEVKFDGKNLTLSIKNATIAGMHDNEVMPFEFELEAKNVKVREEGF